MFRWAIYALIYLGSALMVYNIVGFVRFARYIRNLKAWDGKNNSILYIPIALLVLFLLGYLTVGFFGSPDLIMAGILFGGSVFVFIMYLLLRSIAREIVKGEQLEVKLLVAEESNRVRTDFLAVMSHEMRTPMNVILGLDEVELKNPALPPETRAHLEKIGQSGRHLLGLINNILDMNRLETGALEVKREAFSLSDALGQVGAIAQTQCEEKGLTYDFRMEENTDGCYLGDALQLKQALLCVLDNAVKYTEAPGTVRFAVGAAFDGGDVRTLRFTVSDTGVGIDPEFLPRLFDAFSREDSSATSERGGSGLSLAHAKGVIELMGGRITAESEKNVGSTFTVTVPMQIARCPKKAETPEEPVTLAGRKILLAEDIPENAEIVTDLLELEDAETEHAENGQIALEMFRQSEEGHYDAILMDMRMPVMDGLEATRCIRGLERGDAKTVPILALTANSSENDVKATLEAGMNCHLAKPADAEQLYAALRREMARAKSVRGKDA